MLIVRFIHFLGIAMWVGGGLASLLLSINARQESREVRAGLFRLLEQVHTIVIGLGAFLTVGSGVLWSMSLVRDNSAQSETDSLGFWIMVVAGFLGGLLVVFVAMPTAMRLGRIAARVEEDQLVPAFERYRRRLMSVSAIAVALALVSLFAAVVPQ